MPFIYDIMNNTLNHCLFVFALIAAASCGASRRLPVQRDSVRVETHERTVIEWDTVYIQPPKERDSIVTAGQVSHLENSVAYSDASIDSLGMLHHSLGTRGKLAVPTEKRSQVKDSIVYRDKLVEVPVPVEKKLSNWQEFRLKWFGVLAGLLAAALCWIFRKPVLSFIRRL